MVPKPSGLLGINHVGLAGIPQAVIFPGSHPSFQHPLFFSQRARIQPLINSHLQKVSKRGNLHLGPCETHPFYPNSLLCDRFEV